MKIFSFLLLGVVCLAVSAAAQTRVRITGSKLKNERELLDLIGGRLTHVETDIASTSRADDAAFLLRQVMRKDGYGQAQVDSKVINPREILLTVREGPRLSLGDVEVRGVEGVEGTRLAKIYSRPSIKGRPLTSGSPPFREEDVAPGLALIVQDLNALGYWSAESKLANRATDPSTGAVNLVIDVKTGPLYKIAAPRVTGPAGNGKESVGEIARPFIGEPATTGKINELGALVRESFSSEGFADTKVYFGRTLVAPRYIPEITIELGERVKLDRVEIEGIKRTRPEQIKQRFRTLEGDWYDEAAMNKRMRQLLSTGAFSSARVETEEVAPQTIRATLHLEEARAKEVTLGAGAGSYEGLILRAAYTDRNLFGRLLSFSAGIEVSTRGLLGETRITDPWLYGSDWSLSSRVYALIYGREGYQSFETGIDSMLSRKFGDHYSLEILAGYSFIDTTPEGLPEDELGETTYVNPKFRVTQVFDHRDSPVLPKSGWIVRNPFELGAAIGDESTTSYVKSSLSGSWYHELSKTYQLALGGQVGAIIPSGESERLPIDLRVFNGGARSVRSFPERELGPRSANDYATGGEASWTTNVEISRPLAGPLRAVGFFDAGTVSRTFDDLLAADVELAVGLGLRLDLPIGPVRLEYGQNLTQDEGEPAGTLHFAIGVAF